MASLIERDKRLYGSALLLLASKYDELDDKIPYWNQVCRGKYTWHEFVAVESRIVHALDWDLMVISPENFTTALLSFGIVFSDDPIPKSAEISRFLKSVWMYMEMFTDIALQSMEIQQYSYSVQSVASCVAARWAKNIKPVWN